MAAGWRRLRSDLGISVLSGILLAAVIKIASVVTHATWLSSTVPLWVLTLIGATALALGILLVRTRHQRQRRILLMLPAFVQKHWLAGFLQIIMQVLDSHGFDVVLKFPVNDYSGHDQTSQLAAARQRIRGYSGALIIPAEPSTMQSDLRAFCVAADFPVIFVDVRPFTHPADYPPQSAFVGSDQAAIGAMAADWAIDYLNQNRKKRPIVLVVGGVAQGERQQQFVTVLGDRIPRAAVTVDTQGAFSRSEARDIIGRRLRATATGSPEPDLIFCTNDEMALGAVDAIHEVEATGRTYPHMGIIGVDGTREAKAVIKSAGTAFRATVVQDTRKMAEVAVNLLIKAMNGESVPVETLIPLDIYPRS